MKRIGICICAVSLHERACKSCNCAGGALCRHGAARMYTSRLPCVAIALEMVSPTCTAGLKASVWDATSIWK